VKIERSARVLWSTEWAPFEVRTGRMNEYTIKLPDEVLNVVRDQFKKRSTAR
jgi:hypothetical protein